MTDLEYKRDVMIDMGALETEWEKQAVLYMRYAERASMAEKARAYAKDKLELTEAQIDSETRADLTGKGAKYTEAVIRGIVIADKRRTESHEAYVSACYESDIFNAAVRAMDQKKKALEHLVQLMLAGYFATPRTSKAALESAQKEQRDHLKRK